MSLHFAAHASPRCRGSTGVRVRVGVGVGARARTRVRARVRVSAPTAAAGRTLDMPG